ncbi:MAG TPA: S8 family serine peptidase [Kiritimatiellia bacterium]|nr:S8 family serine peptidase [Kiritimatiellia bacterium]
MRKFLSFGLIGLWACSAWAAGAPLILDWGTLDTSATAQQKATQVLRAAGRATTVQQLNARGAAPWLVQFDDVVQDEWRSGLEAAGAKIQGYMPENGFLIQATPKQIAAIAALAHVAYVGEFLPEYKRAAKVRAKLARVQKGEEADAAAPYRVLLFAAEDRDAVAARIEALTGAPVAAAVGEMIRADLTAAQVAEVTAWGEVNWIEPYSPPKKWNDVAVRTNMMNVSNAWNLLGLTGAGQTIAVCDTGLDTGNVGTLHPDFTNRVTGYGWSNGAYSAAYSWADYDSHGTHVSGSVLGNGTMSTGQFKGVAYQANLVIQGSQEDLSGIPYYLAELFRQAYTNGARIHSDSWGYDDHGYYNMDSRSVDQYVWSNRNFLILIAAGNSGTDSNVVDGVIDPMSVASPATAKNCLTVGAAENYRTTGGYSTYRWGIELWPSDYPTNPIRSDYASRPMSNNVQGLAAFSSRGPCNDGRIKPDIVAPGTDIVSTRSRRATDTGWGIGPNTNYLYMGGTSMATPLMAGAAGLARQWVTTAGGITNPSAALLKALLLNGARDMAPGQYLSGTKQEIFARPDKSQGWGHVDLYNALQPATNQFLDLYDTNSLATGQTNVFTYSVSAGSTNKFIATLAYADYWGTIGSGKQLVNDLDLTVIKPGGTTNFANGRTSNDATNNVEMVELAADEAGTYTVVVAARTVPSGSPQPYALVVRGPADEPAEPDYGMRDDAGANLPTLTYWYDGLGADVTEKGSNFNGRALGTRSQIYLKGAAIKTWKTGSGDVTGTTFHYKIWDVGSAEPGTYSTRAVGWTSDDGGGNQTWANFGAEIDALSGLVSGSYNLKVMFTVAGTGVPGILTNGPFTATFAIAPVQAPGNLRASATNETDFTAAWDAVSGATGYRLDVAIDAAFAGGGSGASVLSENFAGFTVLGGSTDRSGSLDTYLQTTGWTGAAVYENAGEAKMGSSSARGILTSPSLNLSSNGGQAVFTFDARYYSASDASVVQVYVATDGVNFVQSGANVALTATMTTYTNLITNGTAACKVRLYALNAANERYYLDNWLISQGGGTPSYVPGYSNRAVAGTSQSVTGLTANSTYYFRVRTEAAFGTSANSATASVTTLEEAVPGTPPTLDAIPAQTTYVGAELDYAVTAQEPDADVVTFACTSAVNAATWELDANTGDFLFIPTASEIGTNWFSFTAADKDGASAPQLMSVKVYSAAATNEFTQWVEDQQEDPADPDFGLDADVDGDGQTTYEEYLADTDPASSNSVLKLEGLSADLDQFSFPASPNRFYQLEYCTDITNQAGTLVRSNLGWGVPGMVITNVAPTSWFGVIRVLLDEP